MADSKAHVFSSAVKETLRIWPVLTLARQHGFGGRDTQAKEEWLCESVIQIFKDNDMVFPDDLEDFVSEALYNEFDTVVQDGSLKEICTKICMYYGMCSKDEVEKVAEEVKKMQGTQPKVEAQLENQPDDDSSSDEDEEPNSNQESMDVEMDENQESSSGSKQKEFDEDGWEVVRRSKK